MSGLARGSASAYAFNNFVLYSAIELPAAISHSTPSSRYRHFTTGTLADAIVRLTSKSGEACNNFSTTTIARLSGRFREAASTPWSLELVSSISSSSSSPSSTSSTSSSSSSSTSSSDSMSLPSFSASLVSTLAFTPWPAWVSLECPMFASSWGVALLCRSDLVPLSTRISTFVSSATSLVAFSSDSIHSDTPVKQKSISPDALELSTFALEPNKCASTSTLSRASVTS
mmetsp:Transcript_17652/g.31124  ORF Transcript_17652/g.31124 Transcript_17652/m.31124 type:complete len:229 (+) Transcript_17652:97-783(+)